MSPAANNLQMVGATVALVVLIALAGVFAASTPVLVSYLYGGIIGLIYGAVFVRWSRARARLADCPDCHRSLDRSR